MFTVCHHFLINKPPSFIQSLFPIRSIIRNNRNRNNRKENFSLFELWKMLFVLSSRPLPPPGCISTLRCGSSPWSGRAGQPSPATATSTSCAPASWPSRPPATPARPFQGRRPTRPGTLGTSAVWPCPSEVCQVCAWLKGVAELCFWGLRFFG